MTSHPERYIGLCFLLLVLSVIAPPTADWYRVISPPPGYGAANDRRHTSRMPESVRATVEVQSAGAEASWVKEGIEGGAWVYDLHVLKNRKWSVVRIGSNGSVIPSAPQAPEPETGPAAEAGE